MALIKCPECGREISDKAFACPHCGCPIQRSTEQDGTINRNKKPLIIALLVICCIVVGFLVYQSAAPNKTSSQKFMQENGTILIPTGATIQNDLLTDSEKMIIEEALQVAVSDYNDTVGKDRIEFDRYYSNLIKVDMESLLKISYYDEAISDEVNHPIRAVMSESAITVLTATGDWSKQPVMMVVEDEATEKMQTVILAALEYYYKANPEPYLSYLENN